MNKSELIQVLKDYKGISTFISMNTKTTVKLNKKNRVSGEPCPYGDVFKTTYWSNLLVGAKYENRVNNLQEKQGDERDFVAQSRTWGEHVSQALIAHKDKFYIECYFDTCSTINSSYEDNNGNTLTYAELEHYMPIKSDNVVSIINVAIDNITSLTGFKSEYIAD